MTHPWTIELERISLASPFGVRFWDDVLGAFIADGLSVELYPQGRPRDRIAATPNQAGVFHAQGLPGFVEFERGSGMVAPRPFTIEVTDRNDRFVPFDLHETLPISGGLVVQGGETMIRLISSPTRTVSAGTAVVRAELWDAIAKAPAAWAMLEVSLGGARLGRGVADDEGRVAVVFPYPEPPLLPAPAGSPVLSPPYEPQWTLDVRAFYLPTATPPKRPDLQPTLNQPPATLWSDALRTAPLTQTTLRQGHETVLKTSPAAASPQEDTRSRMFLTVP